MTSSTPSPRGTGAKSTVKASAAVIVATLMLNLLLALAGSVMNFRPPSIIGVASGWLIFISLVVLVIAGLVWVMQRSSPPSTSVPMPMPMQQGRAPGWYPDQADPTLMRWFDGQTWTSGTAPRQ